MKKLCGLCPVACVLTKAWLFGLGLGLGEGERYCRRVRRATRFRKDEEEVIECDLPMTGALFENLDLLNVAQAYVLLVIDEHVHGEATI